MTRSSAQPPLNRASQRVRWLDGIRATGVVLVILIHCSDVALRDPNLWGSRWWSVNLFQSFAAIAVGLFVMVSGYVAVSRPPRKDYPGFIVDRIRRIAVPCAAWTVIYGIHTLLSEGYDFPTFLRDTLSGDVAVHLWFVYMILGLYVLSPLLTALIKGWPGWVPWGVVLIWFVGVSVMVLRFEITGFETATDFMLAPLYIGYFLLGGLMARYNIRVVGSGATAAFAVFLVMGAVTAVATWRFTLAVDGRLYPYFYFYLCPNVIVMTVSACLGLQFLARNLAPGSIVTRLVGVTARFSYGIYLGHVLLLESLVKIAGGASAITSYPHPVVGIPMATLSVLLLSLAGAWLWETCPRSTLALASGWRMTGRWKPR